MRMGRAAEGSGAADAGGQAVPTAAPAISDGDEEQRQLEIALELSRKTFMEEEAKRRSHGIGGEAAAVAVHVADLMMVEDPAIVQRTHQIEQIKRMVMEQQQQGRPNESNSSARLLSSATNPFLHCSVSSPLLTAAIVHHPPPDGVQFGASQLLGALAPQHFVAAADAIPSTTTTTTTTPQPQQQQHEQFVLGLVPQQQSVVSATTSTAPTTTAEESHWHPSLQQFVCTNFTAVAALPFPPDQLQQQPQHFPPPQQPPPPLPSAAVPKIHNSFSFPTQSTAAAAAAATTASSSRGSFCCTTSTTNPFGAPLSLAVHDDEGPAKMRRSVSPPLRVPFRSATFDNGDLIDLGSPRSANSMTIEEFDPLYIKQQQQQKKTTAQKGGTTTRESAVPDSFSSNEQLQAVAGCSTVPCTSAGLSDGPTKSSTHRQQQKIESLKKRRASRTGYRMLTCDDLKASKTLSCDFLEERKLLADQCQTIALQPGQNVFFLCPVLDYFVIDEESTIKLLVHQDDTWSRDTPDDPIRLEFTCGARNTSEEILQQVLLDLLTVEQIAQNGDKIPSGDYALKVYGSDEFLVRNVPIGRHPFVGHLLAKGRDVELEVGKSQLPSTSSPNDDSMKISPAAYPTVSAEIFGKFCETLKSHVEKCLADPQDKKLRQPVFQSIKMISTFINNTQPIDLIAAIDMLLSANCADSLANAIACVVAALVRLFRAYCRSALTDFSVVQPPPMVVVVGDGQQQAEEQPCDPPTIMDSSLCSCEQLLFNIESVHNLPNEWTTKYKSFFMEAHLMYGTKSYGMCATSRKTVVRKHQFVNVPLQLWAEFNMHISALPREAQVCFILRGVPSDEETARAAGLMPGGLPTEHGGTSNSANSSGYASARGSATSELGAGVVSAHRLATANLPLYNVNGFLLQGCVLVPLRKMDNDLVHPWGPRPLIRQPDELVLVVDCVDYGYRIQFPTIGPSEMCAREFSSLQPDEQETLQVLVDSAVSHHLTDDDKQLLWSSRDCLHQMPRAFPLVMASASWASYNLGNIYALLDGWAKLPPPVALELLLPYFQDRLLRECAVRQWLANASSVFLFDIIVQLVEALRYESFENSALALFLLQQCVHNRRYAFELYWQLQPRISDAKNPSFSARCQLLQQMLLDLDIPCLANEIAHQHLFLGRLDKVAASVKENAIDGNTNKVLHKELSELSNELDMRSVRIPIAPTFQCQSIAVSDCAIFNSLTRPIKLIIKGKRDQFGIIYKAGDDLRQDAVVLQLVRAMNDIWLSEQLDLRMVLFRCMPTGSKKGLIELVPSCKTLREIQTASKGAAGVFNDAVLNEWLASQNPSEFQYKAALENFRRSCAGWCVATYVLGIGDRHNDNILVTTNGHVFHIDFGKYMGDWQMAAGFKRDRVPFVFTPDLAYVINEGPSYTEHFQRFVDKSCQALNLLRKSSQTVLNIMRFLSCSDIPGMSMDAVNFVENNLLLDLSEAQATMLFTQMIMESLKSKFPRLNFLVHTLAQRLGNPLGGRNEDMNKLSFISELCNEKSEGRIESVDVISYEKWKNPEKVYMYKLLVKRQKQNVRIMIFRSFAEFQELHWKLCCRFSSRAIPQLCHTVVFGRTNIRTVAARRQIDLQCFLQRLFTLSDEVAHSELVYTFMHSIYRDTEPEARKQSDGCADGTALSAHCQLLLRLAWDEAQTEQLRIFVGHAKNLPLVNREQTPNSYVKCYLLWTGAADEQQRQWKRKTRVVDNAQNPTYNAEICYSLSSASLPAELRSASQSPSVLSDALKLSIAVWHCGSLKDNFQIASTIIPLGSLLLAAPTTSRKGVREVERWFPLRLAYNT